MSKLRMMSLRFSTEINSAELSKFRGAVIAAAGVENDLFHNHQGEGFAYRYPLMQYRIMGGRAGFICLNEGIEQMQHLLGSDFLLYPITFGTRTEQVTVEDMRINEFELCFLEEPIRYHISRWQPFNQENYRQWNTLTTPEEREERLKRLLIGNIISFAKGVGWQLERQIEIAIDTATLIEHRMLYKGRRMVAISVDFEANIFLPRGIALGKGVALNKGVVTIPRG